LLRRPAAAIVFAATALYAAVWSALGMWRYANFRASRDDGLFTQVLSSAFSGFHATPEWNFNHFATHFSPALYLIAPLLIATHRAVTLIVVQAIAGALVAPALYLIARRRMPELAAAGCAVVALLYPALAGVTFTDFHESGFEPAAIVWLLWAIDAKKRWFSLGFGLFALGIKEDVAPGLFFGGVLGGLWLARLGDARRSRYAFGLAAGAAVVFFGYLQLLRPALHAPFPYQQFRYYTGDGASPFAPGAAVSRLRYVAVMLLPLGFVPLLNPAVVLALPGLAEVLASRDPITMSLETHYAAPWIGYLLFAFVLGIGMLYRRNPRNAEYALAACAAISLYVLVHVDPLARWYSLYRLPNAHDATLQAMLDALPPDAAISAPDRIYAHLGFDPAAGVDAGGRFVIIDRTDHDVTPVWAQYENELPGLVSTGKYRLVRAVDGIELYEKV